MLVHLQLASYHAASLLVNLSPPTRGVVSRGIGLEGVTTFIAGLWGTGAGSTTLTENIHTLEATKMASRRALQLGAALLVIFSFFGMVSNSHMTIISKQFYINCEWTEYESLGCRKNWSSPCFYTYRIGRLHSLLHLGANCRTRIVHVTIHPSSELKEHDNSWIYSVHLSVCPCIFSAV
jgi:hypothetical protein